MKRRLTKKIVCLVLSVIIVLGMVQVHTVEAKAAAKFETLVNQVPLNPAPPLSPLTSNVVMNIINSITTPEMSTYQKLKICYDHLILTSSYGQPSEKYMFIMDTPNGIKSAISGEEFVHIYDMNAYAILTEHVGVCDHYAAAFTEMAKAIGLESYIMGGMTTKKSGGYTPHAWSIIRIDGVDYVFDAQIEDNISKGGAITYQRFGKTYEQLPGKYLF